MRARNREINIFNMSLLDILCGALGAFCFMMLVALPYYRPGSDDAQSQVDLENTLKEIEKLKQELDDPDIAKKLGDILHKLVAQVKELEGRVNQLASENQQLKNQVDDLTLKYQQLETEKQDLQKRVNDYARREPFNVFVTLENPLAPGQGGRVDLYLWQDNLSSKNEKQKPFDPGKEVHDPYWVGEQTYWITGQKPYCAWMVLNVEFGSTWKIYAKLDLWTVDATDPKKKTVLPIPGTLNLIGSVCSAKTVQAIPDIHLSAEHPWVLAGVISSDKGDNTKLTVRAATDAERAAEWKALEKK